MDVHVYCTIFDKVGKDYGGSASFPSGLPLTDGDRQHRLVLALRNGMGWDGIGIEHGTAEEVERSRVGR